MTTREIIDRYVLAYRELPEASRLLLVSALVVDIGAAVMIVDRRYAAAVVLAVVAFATTIGALGDRFIGEEREHEKGEQNGSDPMARAS